METKVGIRELKDHLSKYVRQVEAGDVVLVTDRGKVVAELAPPGTTSRPDIHPGLLEMERKGLVRLATRPNHPSLYRRMPYVDLGGRTIEDVMDEIRGD
ncbi:MAG: type II toxin-antitoxin system Phd/YefM family antitoxin [Candidatus Limnocylindrales bacterium]